MSASRVEGPLSEVALPGESTSRISLEEGSLDSPADQGIRVLRDFVARTFTFATMAVSVLVAGIYLCCLNRNVLSDPDIWWHLRNARLLIDHHAFLRRDVYTSTIFGQPWLNPEWLSELPYFAAWRLFGFRGIYLLTVGMVEVLALGVGALAWRRLHNIKGTILASCLFLFMGSVSLSPRTQLFGWLCLIAEMWLLEDFRAGRDRLWLLPLVFAAWINLHGSWPIGIVILLVYLCCGWANLVWGSLETVAWNTTERTRLLWMLAVSIAALFLNPYGWRLVAYPFQIAFAHPLTVATVLEWETLDFHGFRGKLVFALLASLLMLSMAHKRKWNLTDLLPLLIATLAAFTYSRFLLLEAIILPPLMAREFTFFSQYRREIDKPWLNFAIVVLMTAFVYTHIPSENILIRQADDGTPHDAVNYLRANPMPGRLFNDFNWGGYLIWNLPGTKVFIDTRADAFEVSGVYADYLDAVLMKQPFKVLDKYDVEAVLLPKADPLSYLLLHDAGWAKRYEDGTAVVLQRRATGPAGGNESNSGTQRYAGSALLNSR